MTPKVFISSTKEDLEPYRTAAEKAAVEAGFLPVMMDYFAAQGHQPPYPACMAKVDPCDVLVVIVAHRYGWIPHDQPGNEGKSITWLECEHAQTKKKRAEVLAFVVDENCNWPPDLRETHRATKAFEDGAFTPELGAEVQRNIAKLKEFKKWLGNLGFRPSFTGPDDLRAKVLSALFQWRDRHREFQAGPARVALDPAHYLRWLRDETAWIDIRGLLVGSAKAIRFPIGDLFIPLKTAGTESERSSGKAKAILEENKSENSGDLRQSVLLEEALRHRKLVITGDPGSGKTTFLRRIAYELCREAGQRAFDLPQNGFPLLIRISELEECINHCRSRCEVGTPAAKDSPSWLGHFLEHRSQELKWNLDAGFFESKLGENPTFVLLDGLDETANQADRESIARLLERATQSYPHCRFVVTTRPGSYQGLSTLAGFHQVTIDDLEPEAIERFLHHWSENLYPGNLAAAQKHANELVAALKARLEIRLMARNPVMLTALAVVHWNERRLPEQRAELYDSIVTWLARSRPREGRQPAERCLELLGHLALAMHNQPQGRLTQVSAGRAAEMIATQFREVEAPEQFAHAQLFLSKEEDDSGIVVRRGSELRFWHLTLQEFLAARSICGLADTEQQKLLLAGGKLYRAEWREVIGLLAGILLTKQGREKVNGLFRAVLDHLGQTPSLAQKAQCVGLLGAILADLRALAYQPVDPRYQSTLDAVLGIFDPNKAKDIALQVRLEAAEALGQAGDPRLQPEKNNWIMIPAGSFLMGAQKQDPKQSNYDPEAYEDEFPVHQVRLAAYAIGKYPVTVEEYRRFMEEDGYHNQQYWKNGGFGQQSQPDAWEEQLLHPNHPVVNVTWYEAAACCAWMGGRLPTEAEWERAARGPKGCKYPWGNEMPDRERANYDETQVGRATPVGLFPLGATPDGIHDLAGNVWEWVNDWYGGYEDIGAENPTGPASGEARIVRGGSWFYGSRFLRSSYRGRSQPGIRGNFIGFRCVREVFP